jgi:hypothetical protein
MTPIAATARTSLPPGKFAVACLDPGRHLEDSILLSLHVPEDPDTEWDEPSLFDTENEARAALLKARELWRRAAEAAGLDLDDTGDCVLHRTASGQLVRIPV